MDGFLEERASGGSVHQVMGNGKGNAALALTYARVRTARDSGNSATKNSDQNPPKTAASLPFGR
jgi:hypothetical protein